ncbi:MAG: 6-hydroxycyclohex-1-ene-1-carbonyl-CoA dehydrogenase [Rhodoplanes sp.]|nr:6-hydroxycyclohex-1-ene-1-carbonyl-CoA dehydrogenase [Rhodoplanes sp.]
MAGGPGRWVMTGKGKPLVRVPMDALSPGPDEVLIEIAGCGVCRTDLSIYYDDAPTRHELPLTLGHEISGHVIEAGDNALWWVDRAVVVPALIPCGHCDTCRRGRAAICPNQKMPGNDIHGGFATHIVVPAHGLCEVDEVRLAATGIELADLAVVADAATSSFQAVVETGVGPGDLVIVIGVGGVGSYAAQIAVTFGGTVVAVDINADKLAVIAGRCALTLNARDMSPADLKAAIAAFADARGLRQSEWIILDCSGARSGRDAAYSLINQRAVVAVIGCSMDRVEIRHPNLMHFHARAIENWGCAPELYPQALELVLNGRVKVTEFIEKHALGEINEVFAAAHAGALKRRAVLVPPGDGETS